MAADWTVERHLDGKTENVVAMYRCFIGIVEACGPFTHSVTKTAITLKGSRRGFAGLVPRKASLNGYLDLQRRVEDPRILRSSPYTKLLYVHHFRLTAPLELDEEFVGLIGEAYAVGQGAHLRSRRPARETGSR
jgi:hypothetical protein